MSSLGPTPVLSGTNFITHDSALLLETRNKFLKLAKNQYENDDLFDVQIEQEAHNQTMVGRIIDITALSTPWYRFMCISMPSGKEYSKPCYAINER